MTSVLIRRTGKQRQTCSEENEHGCDEREGRRHMEIRGALHRPRGRLGHQKLEEARKDDLSHAPEGAGTP